MSRPAEHPGKPAYASITVRLNEDMKKWVKEQGGGKYIRDLIRRDAREKRQG
jgi:hypothetical protein